MKRKNYSLLIRNLAYCLLLAVFGLLSDSTYSQGAAVNTSGAAADPSAMLDVSSNNSGILIPRMTEAQKNAINSPATGLMIYQTDATTGFWYYDGSAWVQSLGATGATGATGSAGTSGLLPSGSSAGNTPYWDGTQWVVSSSNIFNNGGSVGINTSTPDSSAYLDISGTNKGLLIPRMTATDRDLISKPAEALQIYNSTTQCLEIYQNGAWQKAYCDFNCGVAYIRHIYKDTMVYFGTVKGQNGTCWLDRNLGAKTVATAYNHLESYGDLFQWGRLDDGHQTRTSAKTSTLSATDIPGHSSYIYNAVIYDWRSTPNDNLWQGNYSSNNPCPQGWRLPTETELNNERVSWGSIDYNGAFSSTLRLTAGGSRSSGGNLNGIGVHGRYWSSSLNAVSLQPRHLYFDNSNAALQNLSRVIGASVRCIKDN